MTGPTRCTCYGIENRANSINHVDFFECLIYFNPSSILSPTFFFSSGVLGKHATTKHNVLVLYLEMLIIKHYKNVLSFFTYLH